MQGATPKRASPSRAAVAAAIAGNGLELFDYAVPLPDEFTDAEFTKIVDAQGGVRLASYACARKAERLVALRASSSAIALTAGQHTPDDCRGA